MWLLSREGHVTQDHQWVGLEKGRAGIARGEGFCLEWRPHWSLGHGWGVDFQTPQYGGPD